MSTKKKILAISSIRSDYDLLSALFKKLSDDSDINFKLLVSGAHLSPTYGKTIKYIYEDRIPILDTIETLIDSDTPSSRLKTASLFLLNALISLERFSPDVIILTGDREDAIAGALIGAYLKIPTVHFFGGDHTVDGNVDNAVRYSISKLASLHFVIHEKHKARLIRIGEEKDRIFFCGNPGLDKFITEKKISKDELIRRIGENKIKNNDDYAIVIFHPILGYEQYAGTHFRQILQALDGCNIKAFVGCPNTDAGNRAILETIKRFQDYRNFVFYNSLKRIDFVNLMRHAEFIIGNSSCGILEASSIPLGVINVGKRQTGRLAAKNVIFVDGISSQIKNAINKIRSEEFKKELKKVKNPYGDGHSVNRIYKLIKTIDFKKYIDKTKDPLKIKL